MEAKLQSKEDGVNASPLRGMNRDVVKRALLEYLGGSRPRTVACLTGVWGSGKTHLWKEVAAELRDARKQTAYLSLFGVPSLSSAKMSLITSSLLGPIDLDENTDRKVKDWTSRLIETGLDSAGKWLKVDFVQRLVDPVRIIPKDTIVCIDDLERVSPEFKLEDVLGFANALAEDGGCRVLLIMNDDHIEERYEDDAKRVRSYLERVVHRSIRLRADAAELLPFLRESHGIALDDSICQAILDTLVQAKNENIRTLLRALENAMDLARAIKPDSLQLADARFVTALTAEHAAHGGLRDFAFYNFHPIIFAMGRMSKMETVSERREQEAFFAKYFGAEHYRSSPAIAGLVRDGVLDADAYRAEVVAEMGRAKTAVGALLRRIGERDYWFLSDEEAVAWIDSSTALLTSDGEELLAEDVSAIFTVAAFVAEIAGETLPDALVDAARNALISAARRKDDSLSLRRFRSETRLPADLRKTYDDELAAAIIASYKQGILDAIIARDDEALFDAINSAVPASVAAALDDQVLEQLDLARKTAPKFWFKSIESIGGVIKDCNAPLLLKKLRDYIADVRKESQKANDKSGYYRAGKLEQELDD